MSVDLLVQKIKEKGNPSVAGLDPKIEYVPEYIRKKAYAEYGSNAQNYFVCKRKGLVYNS